MPSTPSQKSIDVCRPAPTRVMWWTPWLWSFRTGLVLHELRLVLAALEASPRHEIDASLHHEHVTEFLTDGVGQTGVRGPVASKLDLHREGWVLLHALV